ncbi:MocR-like pyridoxine biosynthesis transcription factor PdxR [Chitinimonas lacunae]|uniref:Putative 8-amino-7-oxononanoate synthase n=1 Tax=Chitinimonas lacunae TaxID=1963018 RepID=A0ABV8MRH9_9NEIS
MVDRTTLPPTPALSPTADEPLYRQLYRRLRQAIIDGRLRPGARLPSTRALAAEWGVGRNTALAAVEQLQAEGYLTARVGAGTYVSVALPDPMPSRPSQWLVNSEVGKEPGLSARARGLLTWVSEREEGETRAFMPGVPDLATFPWPLWFKLLARQQRAAKPADWDYGHEAAHPALRTALVDHLTLARGVVCRPEQIIVTAGMQQALDLLARTLADPGDVAWIEEPGYPGAQAAFTAAGLTLNPIPVDEHGMAWQDADYPPPRLIYVTPSHQYPLGSVLSMARRQALLREAAQHGAWIVEDDYDGEFRHDGRPLAALQGLDRGGRTVYLGTFSKVMFPALALAYMVVPLQLARDIALLQARLYRKPCRVTQAALAEFISAGHFGAHLRRMRGLYANRRDKLLDTLQQRLGTEARFYGAEAGMHLVLRLPGHCNDVEVAHRLAAAGLTTPPLSDYALCKPPFPGLLLGYGAVEDATLRLAAHRLADGLYNML